MPVDSLSSGFIAKWVYRQADLSPSGFTAKRVYRHTDLSPMVEKFSHRK